MRSPEAARALPELVAAGVLTPERAAPLAAAARGEIVTMRAELRALLGLAVALLTTGAGLFVKEHQEALGPLPVALALGLACAAAIFFARRRSAPFTRERAMDRDWILDALVLLAVGLAGADLAWIERQLFLLGENWPLHLLVMSLVTGALAVRFDSIAAWTVALGTFAAWRGVSLAPTVTGVERSLFPGENAARWELLLCAAAFLVLGRFAERTGFKRHFEPATTALAFVAAAIACVSGLAEPESWWTWSLALAAIAAGAGAWAFRRRRRGLFVLASFAGYVAATRFLFAAPGLEIFGCFWFAASTVGAIVFLVWVHRRFQHGEASR